MNGMFWFEPKFGAKEELGKGGCEGLRASWEPDARALEEVIKGE